jgi:histidinol-phosphate aminotransferase
MPSQREYSCEPMDYASLARPVVRQLEPYSAGTTTDQAKRRFDLERVIKLSSNENPRGSSPKALAAIAGLTGANLYADDDHSALRSRLAEPYGLATANTILGHGSNEILLMFFLTFVGPGDEVVMGDPTFSLFPADAIETGATPVRVPLRDGVHDLDAMLAAVTPRTKAVIVCDPNNPTATCVDPEAFARFASALPANVLLFVDQAYREYMPAASVEGTDYVKTRRATIVTRTMSKLYGLASIRFGYAFADPGMIDLMQRVRVPFNVSLPAALAAMGALEDDAFRTETVALNNQEKTFLTAAFGRLGLFAYPSAANFIAVRVPVAADAAYTDLLRRGIIVRSGDKLGLPNFLRITIGLPEENRALVAALEAELPAWREQAPVPA